MKIECLIIKTKLVSSYFEFTVCFDLIIELYILIFQFDPNNPPSQRPTSEPPGYIAPDNKPSIKDVSTTW